MLSSLVFASLACSALAAPALDSPALERRDLTSALGDISSQVSNGLLDAFNDLPDADTIKEKLDITDDQLANVSITIMNIPGYANYTSNGWQLKIHGVAYKIPPLTDDQIDDAAGIFVPDLDISDLTDEERKEARNVTASLLNIPQPDIVVPFKLLVNNSQVGADFNFPVATSDIGEFNRFVVLPTDIQSELPNGTGTGAGVWGSTLLTNDTMLGNASAWFVPEEGVTIVSDIDDILRVTKIYVPTEGLNNSFVNPYTDWMNMPDVYNNWAAQDSAIHFHYLTTLPEQVTRAYESYIYSTYPLGSFDTRPLNFTTVDQTLSIREVLLRMVFETFPKRKFVVVGDTSNGDIMRDYPALASTYPSQLQCILLRNTTATDSSDKFPYDTSGFEGVDKSKYMFFTVPDDIAELDFSKGDCVNTSIQQNVSFDIQGLPLSGGAGSGMVGSRSGRLGAVVGAVVMVVAMVGVSA